DGPTGVPVWSAGRVVAQLPVGEQVASIFYYLGTLILATNRGLRSAVVGDAGALVYGARFVDGNFSQTRGIAAFGDLVYVAGVADDDDGDTRLYSVNVTRGVDETTPAWCAIADIEEAPYGAVAAGDSLWLFDS